MPSQKKLSLDDFNENDFDEILEPDEESEESEESEETEELTDDEPETEDESEGDEPDEESEEDLESEEGLSKSSKKIDPEILKELTEFPDIIREDIAQWPANKRRALKLQQNKMNSRLLKTEQEAKEILDEKDNNETAVVGYLTQLGELVKKNGVTPELAERIKMDALQIATASYWKFEEGLAKQAETALVPLMEDFFINSFGEELADFNKSNPLVSRAIFAGLRYTEPKARKRLLELMKPLVEAQLKRRKATKRKGGTLKAKSSRSTSPLSDFDELIMQLEKNKNK